MAISRPRTGLYRGSPEHQSLGLYVLDRLVYWQTAKPNLGGMPQPMARSVFVGPFEIRIKRKDPPRSYRKSSGLH